VAEGGGILTKALMGENGIKLHISGQNFKSKAKPAEVPSIEDLGSFEYNGDGNNGDGTVKDDPNANGKDKSGGGGGGSDKDKDKEDPRDIRN